MNIYFRQLPFTKAQRERLNDLAQAADLTPVWLEDDVPELADCEVLMGNFPPERLAALPDLRWVQSPNAGVDKLCPVLRERPDVTLTNCAGAFGHAIAEFMVGGLLMLMRHMPAYLDNQRAARWQPLGLCRSIYGSTITVVGTGDIGRALAHIVKAMGATVRGVRRTGAPLADFDAMYTPDQLREAVTDVDAVVMALPGTAETQQLVDADVLAAMDSRTILINCGRGATLDETALVSALAAGHLAGAVLDVTAVEPLPSDSPLWGMENVILTPHISGRNADPVNAEAIFGICADNLQRYAAGQPLIHVVDCQRGY